MADVGQFANVQDYTKSLCRSARCTLKRMHKVQEQYEIKSWTTTRQVGRCYYLGWDHWCACLQHEKRLVGRVRGILQATLRFWLASFMHGTVYEYVDRQTGKLVAWTMVICKGRTMRVMWFYQSDSTNNLWFHAVYHAVMQCIQHRIAYLDIGTSGSSNMETVKAKYGFCSTIDWNAQYSNNGCDYSGHYFYFDEDVIV